MPIPVVCPKCHRRLTAKDSQAGQMLRCPNCRAQVDVLAPVPEPLLVPSQVNVEPVSAQPLYDLDEPPGPRSRAYARSVAGEPWYYRFLETYAKVFVALFILVEVLIVLASLVSALPMVRLMMDNPEAGTLGLILVAVGGLASVVLAALFFVGVIFWCALILLAVDMGRQLRALRRNSVTP